MIAEFQHLPYVCAECGKKLPEKRAWCPVCSSTQIRKAEGSKQ